MDHTPLEAHRIQSIQTFSITCHYPRLVGRNARRDVQGWGPTIQLRAITTDQGALGWGISPTPQVSLPSLLGKRVSQVFDPQTGVTCPEAMALDFPLHDLGGVILDQPVYAMLGSQGDTVVPCYDGAIYIDDVLPEASPRGIAAILENCRQDYALGYRAFKVKIGRGHRWMDGETGLNRDIEVTRTVREHFPDCAILVDANDGYTCDGFLRYLDAVAECDLYWVEEPFPENHEDLSRLRSFLANRSPRTYIADGEGQRDVALLLSLAKEGLLDVLMMDIAGLGFTQWRRWMPLIRDQGVHTSPHTWGNPLKMLCACHLAAGMGNVVTVEGVPGTIPQVDWGGYHLRKGKMHVPSVPGFGVTLLDAAIIPQ